MKTTVRLNPAPVRRPMKSKKAQFSTQDYIRGSLHAEVRLNIIGQKLVESGNK